MDYILNLICEMRIIAVIKWDKSDGKCIKYHASGIDRTKKYGKRKKVKIYLDYLNELYSNSSNAEDNQHLNSFNLILWHPIQFKKIYFFFLVSARLLIQIRLSCIRHLDNPLFNNAKKGFHS